MGFLQGWDEGLHQGEHKGPMVCPTASDVWSIHLGKSGEFRWKDFQGRNSLQKKRRSACLTSASVSPCSWDICCEVKRTVFSLRLRRGFFQGFVSHSQRLISHLTFLFLSLFSNWTLSGPDWTESRNLNVVNKININKVSLSLSTCWPFHSFSLCRHMTHL